MLQSLFCLVFVLFLIQPEDKLQVLAVHATIRTTRDCVLHYETLPNCNGIKYQSLNGSCNNPINPLYGKSWTPFKRLVAPSYGNRLSSSRLSSRGTPLPLSRVISNAFNYAETEFSNPNSSSVNAMFVQFGQYMTHDMTGAPTQNEENGRPVSCTCSNPSPSCMIIPIPKDDPFLDEGCIARKGSARASQCDNMTATPLAAEQLNRLSAFIDAETIYGWNEDLLTDLRDADADDGTMRLVDPSDYSTSANDRINPMSDSKYGAGCPMHRNKRLLLSLDHVQPYLAKRFACPAHLESPVCFVSGDDRVNENIGLASTHLIFTREHNRIARRLKLLNNMWDSDTIFQQARRIVITMHQMITYNEFLPLLLGPKLMRDFDLEIVKNGYYYGYDATYDASVTNSFATAAFRYGHSQVGVFYDLLQANYEQKEDPSIRVFKGLFQEQAVLNGSTPAIMRGLMVDPAKVTDLLFVEDMRNRMFESSTQAGLDLLSINIERGRTHGLASYNEYRDFCGLQRASRWSDLERDMPASTIAILESVYENVDDVDLYVGGVAETPLPEANVGPTFGCIIGYQLRDIRKGDRFWFENPGQFSQDQLQEIRKVTFSSILCNNMNGMITISPRAMELEGETNTRIPCSDVPQINLNRWEIIDHEQNGVWTRWFPTYDVPRVVTLQRILADDPESVCTNPLNYEMQAINESSDSFKIRFKCPTGSISYTGYPNVKENLNNYWTPWIDRDSPNAGNEENDIESLDIIMNERPGEVCDSPLYLQARTKEGLSAFDSSEVFAALSPKSGLICYGSNQTNGRCRDYRVRFYCPKKDFKGQPDKASYIFAYVPDARWTQWINIASPNVGFYDLELLITARSRGYSICPRPLLIEARVAGTNITAAKSGDVFRRFNVYDGLICDNRDQVSGRCHDYEVRYLCSASTTSLSKIYNYGG